MQGSLAILVRPIGVTVPVKQETSHLVIALVAGPVQGGRAFVVQTVQRVSQGLEVQQRNGLSGLGRYVHHRQSLVIAHPSIGMVLR